MAASRGCMDGKSLSARRAWIEIAIAPLVYNKLSVALRKESVDRNFCKVFLRFSCSSVALRKESVDRNADFVLNT